MTTWRRGRPLRALAPLAAIALVVGPSLVAVAPALEPGGAHFPSHSLGDRGLDVLALQYLLIQSAHPVIPDGLYGAATADAVQAFEATHGLPPDGVADPDTWAALAVPLGLGSAGPAVLPLQRQLEGKHGAAITVPAVFGPNTGAAVSAFQAHMGLAGTGSVDAET